MLPEASFFNLLLLYAATPAMAASVMTSYSCFNVSYLGELLLTFSILFIFTFYIKGPSMLITDKETSGSNNVPDLGAQIVPCNKLSVFPTQKKTN